MNTIHQIRKSTMRSLRALLPALMLASILAGLIPPPLVTGVADLTGLQNLSGLAGALPQAKTALAAGTVSGTVFQDYDSDGVKDSATAADPRTDSGVAGVTVTVYDAAGAAQGSAVTSSTGAYSISAGGTGPYRVEFTTLPTGYYPTFHNSTSGSNTTAPNGTATTAGTTVQFVPDGGASNVNLGINVPTDYSQVNPKVVLPVFKPGNTGPAILTFSYDAPKTGNGIGIPQVYSATTGVENPVTLATPAQIGVTWGAAYQRTQKRIFTTSLLRRHAAMADGPGYVYMLDPTSGYLGKFNLAGVTPATGGAALNFGTVTRTTSGLSTDDNNVSGELNRDLDAFAKVGTMGFGDADMDETGNTLWTVNLFERTLLAIDVSQGTAVLNNASPATLQPLVREYDIASLPNAPSCAGIGILRPWGLGFEQGKGYLGIVCDASLSNNVANLDAYVSEFDPSNPSAGFAAAPAVSFGLDYNRELASAFSSNGQFGAWKAWTNDWTTISTTASAAPSGATSPVNHHMPLVSDIDFTDDGSMVIGLLDRTGFMLGFGNYMPVAGSTILTQHNAAGDILHACNLNGAFVLEGTGGCTVQDDGTGTTVQSTNANYNPLQPASVTSDGPSNNGEFYYEDAWARASGHNETSLGSLTVLPGRDEVVYTVYDPLGFNPFMNTNPFGLNTNGIHYDNSTTGANQDGYLLFTGLNTGENVNNYVDKRFGKAGGLGDLELLADPAPIEIGNRVWLDSDNDGVQDPDEAPISGVTVELYKSGVKVGRATTDATGEYYFVSGTNATDANTSDNIIHDSGLGIIPGTGTVGGNSLYEIRIPNVSGGSKQAALGTNELTTANAGSNDSIDSDGALSGVNASYAIPYADLVGPGYNNHTYDFGFGPATGTITIVKQTDGTDDTFDFSSADGDLDAVSLTTSSGTGSSTTFTKNVGTYTISEDALAGWTLDNIEITGDTDGGSSVALPGGGTPAQCTDYFLDWGNISISPGGNYPHVQTITGVGGSNVDLTLTIERQGQDQNFNENFSQVQPYQDGDNSTLRTFRQANGDDFIVRLTMSEAVVINSMLFGGQRTFSSTNAGVAELTAWDGPDGTGNKVSANYANPSSSTTVAAPAAIPGTAAINILTGSGYGSQNAGYDNGTYIVVGTSSTRPWTVIDYNGASVRSFTWETYGSDSSDPAQARANENTIDHEFLSANLGRFYFQECEPAVTEGTATIDLDAGENIVVTFTNSRAAPQLQLDKELVSPANGVAVEGETVIFSLTISNTGAVSVTELNLSDSFDSDYLQFSSASIAPDTTGAGTLNWVGDSVAGTGSLLGQLPLGPGDSFVVTVEFVAMKP